MFFRRKRDLKLGIFFFFSKDTCVAERACPCQLFFKKNFICTLKNLETSFSNLFIILLNYNLVPKAIKMKAISSKLIGIMFL